MSISPRKKRNGRLKAIRGKNKSGRARREWLARSLARDARIAEPFCKRVSIPKASARSALSSCTAASNAPILTRPRDLNACSLFWSVFPARTSGTTAGYTNFARRSKKTRRLQPRLQDQRFRPSMFRDRATRGKHLKIFSKNKSSCDRSIHSIFPQHPRFVRLQPPNGIVILNLL